MRILPRLLIMAVVAVAFPAADAQESDEAPAIVVEPTACELCHGESDLWEGDTRRLFVTPDHLQDDVHWQKGLRCHDCHGGDKETTNFLVAHSPEAGFRPVKTPGEVPGFCGHCHSDIEYMRRYQPSPRTDQVAEYWTSGHGLKLKTDGDAKVATCISCHGGHDIRAAQDVRAPVYPTRLAQTCATCHSDQEQMSGLEYHGKPLGHDQHELWKDSVHAEALLKRGDLSSATCNDCHGNHGALPPEIGSVANACGTCHVKVAKLFAETQMKHRFEQLALPGCAACHGNHDIHSPTDEMLGMGSDAVCARCHQDGKFGATIAGANEARELRSKLEQLKGGIAKAKEKIEHAERLGMEVRGPRFDLRQADAALTNARSLIHSFALEPTNTTLVEGLTVTEAVQSSAEQALQDYTRRRIWLGVSLAPILLVVVLLLLYIRQLPVPSHQPQ